MMKKVNSINSLFRQTIKARSVSCEQRLLGQLKISFGPKLDRSKIEFSDNYTRVSGYGTIFAASAEVGQSVMSKRDDCRQQVAVWSN